MSKMSLKEAREQDKLGEFIKEHEEDACGDADKIDKTLKSALNPTPPRKKESKQKR